MNSTNSTFDKNAGYVTTKLTLISCSFSLFGGFIIIYTYHRIDALRRSYPRRFLVNITYADLIISSGFIVGALRYMDLYLDKVTVLSDLHSDRLCQVQSFLTTYGSIASFMWTDVLAIYLFRIIRFGARNDLTKAVDILFKIIGWILPGVIMLMPTLSGALGEDIHHTDLPWCWLQSRVEGLNVQWTLLAGKLYEIVTYTISIVLYVYMKYYIRKCRTSRTSRRENVFEQTLRTEDEYFWLTWIILLTLRLPGTIRTFLILANPDSGYANRTLLYLQSFGDGFQAFVNCVCYCGFDHDIRDYVKDTVNTYKRNFCRYEYEELE